MKVIYNIENIEITAFYDNDGYLDFVENNNTGEKLMIEIYQEGIGYTIKKNVGFMSQDTCEAIYVRIMDFDIFIPKFIFIKNKR